MTMTLNGTTGVTTPASVNFNNMPAVIAYQSSGQNIPNTTVTKVTYQTVVNDTNSNFASSTFTPTIAGYYQVSGGWSGTSTGASAAGIYMYKNGTAYANGASAYVAVATQISTHVSSLVYLNGSTDYIEMYAYQAGTVSMATFASQNGTYFQACLVRSA